MIAAMSGTIENATAFDSTGGVPAARRFETTTFGAPIAARSSAVIVALSCVELMTVVVRRELFQVTVEFFRKLRPRAVRGKSLPPTTAPGGDRDGINGLILMMTGKGGGRTLTGFGSIIGPGLTTAFGLTLALGLTTGG